MNFEVINSENGVKITDMFGTHYRKAMLICMALVGVQQFCGINPIYIFSDSIFKEGFDPMSGDP